MAGSKGSSGLFPKEATADWDDGDFEAENANDANTNKFADKTQWPSTLEEGKQGKHIKGHPNYMQGKSTLTISMQGASELVEKFSGTGDVVGDEATSNRERVDFDEVIGQFIGQDGIPIDTTNGIIHHSKKGTHIVPANPN